MLKLMADGMLAVQGNCVAGQMREWALVNHEVDDKIKLSLQHVPKADLKSSLSLTSAHFRSSRLRTVELIPKDVQRHPLIHPWYEGRSRYRAIRVACSARRSVISGGHTV
jgi:hypothetical protein